MSAHLPNEEGGDTSDTWAPLGHRASTATARIAAATATTTARADGEEADPHARDGEDDGEEKEWRDERDILDTAADERAARAEEQRAEDGEVPVVAAVAKDDLVRLRLERRVA